MAQIFSFAKTRNLNRKVNSAYFVYINMQKTILGKLKFIIMHLFLPVRVLARSYSIKLGPFVLVYYLKRIFGMFTQSLRF